MEFETECYFAMNIECYQYISSSEGFDAQFQPNLAKDLQKMTNHMLGKRLF